MQLADKWYIRDPRWKYTQAGELFDMKDAPFKQILAAPGSTDLERRAARERLKTALDRLRASEPASSVPKKKKKKNQKP